MRRASPFAKAPPFAKATEDKTEDKLIRAKGFMGCSFQYRVFYVNPLRLLCN